MADVSPAIPLDVAQSAVQDFDFFTILLVLIPFIAFLVLLHWGDHKKNRKKTVIELSYNLIALELLFLLLFPICLQPFDCGFWAIIPIAMFGLLGGFVYRRKNKDEAHERRLAKAVADGHLKKTHVIAGKLEEELKKSKEFNLRKKKIIEDSSKEDFSIEEDLEKAAKTLPLESKNKLVEKPRMPAEKKKPDHKKIQRAVERIISKKD
jgi:hypothetical protein